MFSAAPARLGQAGGFGAGCAPFHRGEKNGGSGIGSAESPPPGATRRVRPMNIAQQALILLLRVYQKVLSPILLAVLGPSARCRFSPSCSQYALEAVRLHGAIMGGALGVRRLCRCHPWGDCGEDRPPSAPLNWSLLLKPRKSG